MHVGFYTSMICHLLFVEINKEILLALEFVGQFVGSEVLQGSLLRFFDLILVHSLIHFFIW